MTASTDTGSVGAHAMRTNISDAFMVVACKMVWRGCRTTRVSHGLEFDLAAQLLDDSLKLSQTLHKLQLSLARRLFGRRIRVFRSGATRGSARGREDTWYLRSAAVGAGHVFVAANLPPPTCYAAARVENIGWGGRGRVDRGARGWMARECLDLLGVVTVVVGSCRNRRGVDAYALVRHDARGFSAWHGCHEAASCAR